VFYVYFPYAAAVAALIFFECHKKNFPAWWAGMVLCAPVTTPYFIYKIRRRAGMMLIIIFVSTFSAVCFTEWFLYVRYMEKNRYAHLSPLARQIIYLSEEVKKSTVQLDSALVKLENLSKVEARINEIKKTLQFIKELRIIMVKNQTAIHQLVKLTLENQSMFKSHEFEWIFNIQRYYNNRNVVQHYNSLKKYLNEFEALLEYTYINFYNIRDHKIEKHLRNYDEYYLRYRGAVDSHNRFNVRRIEFQNDFLKKYPEIKDYLPGERQTETFKLWQ
jgi:hypothetical protein